jgi:hypothetical protein
VDRKIYSMGGGTSSSDALATLEEYDPITDTWTRKANMPTARWGLSSSAVDGKIYAVGGALVSNVAVPTVEEYDTGLAVLPPDFNGDGVVDIKDLLRLIESWGQGDPMCDIAPSPFGDGVVDRKDLEVLMSYWGREIPDPTLIACWRLDEADGDVAADAVGTRDGLLVGDPIWQPSGGKIGGALQFDGMDDSIVVPFVLNPSAQPFSVFAWVRDGGPGQVVLSQDKGADWLMVAPDGALKTGLKGSRVDRVLVSPAVITDDAWHRIGLVWDGSNRILYVDDGEVARDTQSGLASSTGGLYIGVGSTLTPGSLWCGLIDDIRVYNRVVKP